MLWPMSALHDGSRIAKLDAHTYCCHMQKDAVDLKLLVTTPGVPLHADMFMMGRQVSKVKGRIC